MKKQKILTVTGCGLWIAGLIVFIIGLNLDDNTGSWMTAAGSIAFLIGLGITGALWLKRKGEKES